VNEFDLQALLRRLASGEISAEAAGAALRRLPVERLDHATIDGHRHLRCGFPEVVYGEGKTPAQILDIAARIVAAGDPLLATRLSPEALAALSAAHPAGEAHPGARLFRHPGMGPLPPAAPVAVVSAGTSDQPVAEEAALTAEAMGAPVRRIRDAGVAGIHRLLEHETDLRAAAALVVVAGMEGALPSVVGGLVDRPVIAVPTSVGYGAHLGGLTPLFAMLNSCASGVTVVNIDNGFGAGTAAARIARLAASTEFTAMPAAGPAS